MAFRVRAALRELVEACIGRLAVAVHYLRGVCSRKRSQRSDIRISVLRIGHSVLSATIRILIRIFSRDWHMCGILVAYV